MGMVLVAVLGADKLLDCPHADVHNTAMTGITLNLTYTGRALEDGSMNIRDLVPVLMAVNDMFQTAAHLVYDKDMRTAVQVTGFQKGSFSIDLTLIQDLYHQITSLLDSQDANALLNLREYLLWGREYLCGGILGGGVFGFLKKIRGRKIIKTTTEKDQIRIECEGETIVVPTVIYNLSQNITIRTHVETIMRPLQQDGIDGFEIRDKNQTILNVQKDEEPFFRANIGDVINPPIAVHEFEKYFTLITVTFKEGNKWKLYDGTGQISANILDEDFLRRVEDSEVAFTKGDQLRCLVRLKEYRTPAGIRNEYEILRVLDHRPGLKQPGLPL
jgi:hypothetical protein